MAVQSAVDILGVSPLVPRNVDTTEMGAKTGAVIAVNTPALSANGGSTDETASDPPPPQVDTTHALVFLKPSTFRAFWLAIVSMHLLCATFVVCVAVVYLYARRCIVSNTVNTYGIAIDKQYWSHVAAMYYGLAAIHVWLVGHILVRSIRARTFALKQHHIAATTPRKTTPKPPTRRTVRLIQQATTKALNQCDSALPSSVSSKFKLVWRILVVCRQSMFVRNENYGIFFLVRGAAQIVLQSYQAYRLAGLLPRLWMNNVIVSLLIFKCWSTTVIQYVFPDNVGKLRLTCMLVSLALDFVSHAAIPLALFWPYMKQFNYEVGDFALELWYTDVWFAETINEVQLMFVTSLGDAASKFLVALSLARCLDTIAKLIRVMPPKTPPTAGEGGPSSRSTASIVPGEMEAIEIRTKVLARSATWKSRVENGGQRVLFLWGIVVLVAHLHAASIPVHPQCLLRTRPWFTTKPSCSLLGYDCYQEKSTGVASEFDAFLEQFDLYRVGFFVVSECPQLEFPPRFNNLNVLLGLKLFRSTIYSWTAETALTNTHHPKFLSIFLVDVNMTEMPAGLLSPDFPQMFLDIEVVETNMSRLPDNLDTVWPKGMILILENSNFNEFPSVLQNMEPTYLSLAKNNISVVPAHVLELLSPIVLFLGGNPVESLPSNLTSIPTIGWMNLAGTKLTDLPDWIDVNYLAGTIVEAGGTPFCERMIKDGLASETEPLAEMGIPGLDCSMGRILYNALGWYPPGEEQERNPSYVV